MRSVPSGQNRAAQSRASAYGEYVATLLDGGVVVGWAGVAGEGLVIGTPTVLIQRSPLSVCEGC